MFTVGLLLFELVAGRHPLARQRDEGTVALLKAIAHGEIPSLLAEHPDTPLPIAQLVTRLTAREPRDRFDTWADVLAALDGAARQTEQATDVDVAAVVRGLLPDAVAAAEAYREQMARLPFDDLLASLPPWPGTGFLALDDDWRGRDTAVLQDLCGPFVVQPLPAGWDDVTPAETAAPFVGHDGRGLLHIDDALRIDEAPVSNADWARFCAHSGHAPPSSWRGHEPPPEQAARPVTQVSFDDAAAYAAFYEKALPTNDEWQRAIDAVGAARIAAGAVWEWTTTPMLHGHVVRGGRFRDRPKVPSDGQTSSWQDAAADDVGFRCVVRVGAAYRARPPG
jgi:hypothetical protein